jgi:hypothetical protein
LWSCGRKLATYNFIKTWTAISLRSSPRMGNTPPSRPMKCNFLAPSSPPWTKLFGRHGHQRR